jgi:hypothetical protein
MCGGCGLEFIAPVLAFDFIVGTRIFLAWTKQRGLQSFKAMGVISSILCAAGGLIYAMVLRAYVGKERRALALLAGKRAHKELGRVELDYY